MKIIIINNNNNLFLIVTSSSFLNNSAILLYNNKYCNFGYTWQQAMHFVQLRHLPNNLLGETTSVGVLGYVTIR